jgi:hypothetical protein
VTRADFTETDGTSHQLEKGIINSPMAHNLIEGGRCDEGIVICRLMVAIGVPAISPLLAVCVEEIDEVSQLLRRHQIVTKQIPIVGKEFDIRVGQRAQVVDTPYGGAVRPLGYHKRTGPARSFPDRACCIWRYRGMVLVRCSCVQHLPRHFGHVAL